jgi:hypothetical protein
MFNRHEQAISISDESPLNLNIQITLRDSPVCVICLFYLENNMRRTLLL